MDLLIQLGGIVATAGAVYGAIKSDLKHMSEKIIENQKRLDVLEGRVWDASHSRRN